MSKKFGKIWTITTTDDLQRDCVDRCVAGSYTSYDRAVDELVEWVFERIELRDDLAYAFAHDENHPEMDGAVEWEDGKAVFQKPFEEVEKFVREEISQLRCYYIWDGEDSFHFDLDENDLVFEDEKDVGSFVENLTNEK